MSALLTKIAQRVSTRNYYEKINSRTLNIFSGWIKINVGSKSFNWDLFHFEEKVNFDKRCLLIIYIILQAIFRCLPHCQLPAKFLNFITMILLLYYKRFISIYSLCLNSNSLQCNGWRNNCLMIITSWYWFIH